MVNVLVLQCGGPTPVVNASLAAAIAACQAHRAVRQIWGARLGLQGLVRGDWVDLTELPATALERLNRQPGAALGSGRYRLREEELPAAFAHLEERRIGVLLLMGGNGTMAAAHRLERHGAASGYTVDGHSLQVVGIPKTVDNDLAGTEVAPGYGSAARFIAQTVRDIGLDLQAMRNFDDVAVLEVMGRHAGWLAAAAALARAHPDDAPHLILVPERPLDEEAFLAAVAAVHRRRGVCLVVAAEGLRDPAGHFLAEKLQRAEVDASGQRMLGLAAGVAPYLAHLVRSRLGLLCRQQRPDTIQRSCRALALETDRQLAALVGRAGVEAALAGVSGHMVGLRHTPGGWETELAPFTQVVDQERHLPASFLAADAHDLALPFYDYAHKMGLTVEGEDITF